MAARIKNLSKTFVWILLAMVIAGLGGYGALNLSGTVRTVATVGDEVVTTDQFARELQREIRALEAQTGQRLQPDQIRQFGLDQMVLARLITIAAIDNDIARIGLSVSDENLQKEILKIPAFQGPDGKFDRDTYKYQLEQAGMTEAEFEEDLRKEQARTLVQGAIVAGARMPPVLTETIAAYVGERRSFTMAPLTADTLKTPVAEPTEEDLRAYYEAHKDDFRLPETKKITYALLSPEMVMDQVEVDEAEIRKLYDARRDKYDIPERRLVERLVFPDEQSARDAKAQLEVGGTTFEALVRERGLELTDVDMGDVSADDLGDAAEPVFAAKVGDVVGPVQTDLGPALFRVNGTLAAHHTPFEEARAELREELAGEAARRVIDGRAEAINDLLAGGATLEELAREEGLRLEHLDWTPDAAEGIAAYDAFRKAAAKATRDDYPEAQFLDDGGLFALRVDEVLPPRPEPFEQARDKVASAWRLAETEKALRAEAERILAELGENGDLAAAGLETRTETGLTRTAFVEGTPPDFMQQVFKMTPGEIRVIGSGAALYIVRLDAILPPEDNDQMRQLRTGYAQQADQALGQALFQAYAQDARRRAQPTFDQQAVAAVQANLR